MKTHTSRTLKTIALIYMAFPASYLLIAGLLFDIPANLCVSILLSPTYWMLSFLAAISGFGLWEMRRWSWHLFMLVTVLIAYTNAVLVAEYSSSHHQVIAFLSGLAGLVMLAFRVSRELRVPYFLPRIRWWESNPRYKLSLPVRVDRGPEAKSFDDGHILDLSIGGAFLKLRHDFVEDEVTVHFNAFSQELSCRAFVVWRATSTVTHPKGIGVKFGALNRQQKRALRAVSSRLRKINRLYRTSRYLMNQDEFDRRMHELLSAKLSLGKEEKKEPVRA